jgi:hypothetical protein
MSEPVMQIQMISVHAGDSLYKTDRSSVKSLRALKNWGSSSGPNVMKLFLSVIYKFSYQARVFVIQVLKSLPKVNTVAYWEYS